jgi:hypothetical protein
MAPNRQWLLWCQSHKAWLAEEFLKRIERNVSVNDFFGSWFDIHGRKQTGYFLGHAFVLNLEKTYSLKDAAVLNFREVKELGLSYLKATSAGGAD